MIVNVFTWLSNALYSAPYIALIASFVWGVLSIVLSPCHLASIPLIVGFIDKQGKMTTKRAFMLAVLFSLGILITIAFIGLVTGFPFVINAILLGILLGGVGAFGTLIYHALRHRRIALNAVIPYGPFLCIAGWVVMVFRL